MFTLNNFMSKSKSKIFTIISIRSCVFKHYFLLLCMLCLDVGTAYQYITNTQLPYTVWCSGFNSVGETSLCTEIA